jgi:hypothetical protein
MKRARATSLGFLRFWWDFVVGDDWRAAAGIALGLGIAAALVAAGVDAWWLIPAAVAAVLYVSLRRETRKASRAG